MSEPEPDEFEVAADLILSGATKRKAAPRPEPEPKPILPGPSKRGLRAVVREAVRETLGFSQADDVNTVTNRLWKLFVRPALARAWDDGFEAGADHISECCGCSGLGDPPTNPYRS